MSVSDPPRQSFARKAPRSGLALSELLLVVFALTLILSLIVSLSRRVRRESAHALAEQVLLELDAALTDYGATDEGSASEPDVLALFPAETPGQSVDESELRTRALSNNRQIVRLLNVAGRADRGERAAPPPSDDEPGLSIGGASVADDPVVLDTLGLILFDGNTLLDPWGTPVVFMPKGDRRIGTATKDRPFFFSAGPDGRFLSREDNVYSYEVARPGT